ncbi:MAG: hypothetical protein HQK49_19290 [Oligoflexia bacterium]|nr:hypothetical protein [Oligoflexia bacterium]
MSFIRITLILLSFLLISIHQNKFNSFAQSSPPKFNNKEDCSTINGELQAAKHAAITSCKWIEELGSGDKNDEKSAFYKIAASRFCENNYVWIQEYIPNLTDKTPAEYKTVLLHPVKPALENDLKLIHKEFARSYKIVEQHNLAASLNNGKGCWDYYYWTKPGQEIPTEKISFIIRCKDKITGKEMMAAAGAHATHATYKKINPPECNGTDNPHPYEKK